MKRSYWSFKTKSLFKMLLIILFGCWIGGALLLLSQNTENASDAFEFYIAGIVWFVVLVGACFYRFLKIWKEKDYWAQEEARIKKIEAGDKNSLQYRLLHPFNNDLNTLKLLSQDPVLALPFVVSIIFISLFLYWEFSTKTLLGIEGAFLVDGWKGWLLYVFVLSFVCTSLFIMGYLILAEIMQRRQQKARHYMLVDMVINYFYAIPFIIILSIFFIIFVFIGNKENQSTPSSIGDAFRSFSVYALLIVLKYYTYINLAIIACEDHHQSIPFRTSFEFFDKERKSLFFIWCQSGLVFVFASALIFVSIPWIEFFGGSSMWTLIAYIIALFLWILWGLMVEQISFLRYFLEKRKKV